MNCYFIIREMSKMDDSTVADDNLNKNNGKINSGNIPPLGISYEEYEGCLLVLAKEALENNDPKACQKYFEFKKRATFGDGYPEIEGMEQIEKQMLTIGNIEKAIYNARKR